MASVVLRGGRYGAVALLSPVRLPLWSRALHDVGIIGFAGGVGCLDAIEERPSCLRAFIDKERLGRGESLLLVGADVGDRRIFQAHCETLPWAGSGAGAL